jgi:hypothetical protein
MGMELDGTVKALVTEAIFKAIDAQKREELVKAAIGSLLEKDNGFYGPKISKLQECFNNAAYQVARDIISEQMVKDEKFKAAISSVVADGLKKVWDGDKREELVTTIASSVVHWMTPKRD